MQAIAQNTEQGVEKNEQLLKKDFSVLNTNSPTDLIPFCKNGKWGFLNKTSKKIIVPAKYSSLNFFNPNMLNGTFNDETEFYIDSTGKIVAGAQQPEMNELEYKTEIHDEKEFVSSKDGFKGFSVNNYGEITTLSDLYDKCCGFVTVNIKGKTYLILSKNKYYGIIDSLGTPLNGFNFGHHYIEQNYYSKYKDTIWFFVKNSEKKWSLQNNNGEVRFNNEIQSDGKVSAYSTGKFGVVLISYTDPKGEINSGVFDCYEMNWIVQPQKKFTIVDIDYSSKQTLDINNPLDRKKAAIYFLIKEKDNSRYYMDANLRVYYPN